MDLEGAFFNTSDYEQTDTKIGEGAFGKVYLVQKVDDGSIYAGKIINVQKIVSGKEQMLLMRESAILHLLRHPAIVKFYGVNFHSFNDPLALEPTILTEYISHGSFKEVLKKEQSGTADHDWTPTKKYICLLGITSAMKYLHKKGVLHRDLKPENILVDDDFYPKICDFGLSRCFSESLSKSMQLSMTGKIGTPLYMAPELLTDDNHFGTGVDVYSFAVLAYEIVSGKEPYSIKGKSLSLAKLVKKVVAGERPIFDETFTDKMQSLISRCWSQNPEDRPTFDEIFDELSSDFSYFNEDVDGEEINNYLEILEEAEKEDIKSEKKTNESQIKDLKQQIEQMDTQAKELNDQLTNSNQQNKQLNSKIDELNQKVKQMDTKTRELNDKLTNSNQQSKQQDSQINELKQQIKQMDTKNKDLNDQLTNSSQQNKQLNSQINDLKKQKEQMDTKNKELNDQLTSSNQQNKQLNSQINELNQQVKQLSSQPQNQKNDKYDSKTRDIENQKYVELIKDLTQYSDSIHKLYIKSNKCNALHIACRTGNLDLVKYLVSLNKFNIAQSDVFICLFYPVSIIFDL